MFEDNPRWPSGVFCKCGSEIDAIFVTEGNHRALYHYECTGCGDNNAWYYLARKHQRGY